jgi:hypothetical protein
MLITNRQYPILANIKSKSFNGITCLLKDRDVFVKNKESMERFWKSHAHKFDKRVRVISKPFVEAYQSAKDKLRTAEIIDLVDTQSGTIMYKSTTVCYDVVNTGHGISVKVIYFYGNMVTSYYSCDDITGQGVGWMSSHIIPAEEQTKIGMGGTWASLVIEVTLMLNFLKYAQIETKMLPANKKVKDIACKYVNQTDYNIEYVNSTWFTNLVKSNGFKVRGHFRLQPCGVGMRDHKLIWISDFQKQGYTAPARKLKEYPNVEIN